jgi:hypothetical protein
MKHQCSCFAPIARSSPYLPAGLFGVTTRILLARTFAFSAVLAVGSALRLVHLNELSTTPDNTNGEHRFTITHPFHPLCGHTLPLLSQRFAWGEERVFFPRTAILAEAITTHAVVSCLDSYITVMAYSFYDDHLRCVGRANA